MSWDFVGRFDELAALEAAWLAAEGGGVAPVVVVYGEPGIGKTRTVAEFTETVRGRGAEVLWGTCYEGGDAHPYGVWVEAIRGYVTRLGCNGLEAVLGVDVRWLAPLLGGGSGVGFGRVSAPAGVARARLAEVLARVLDSFERPPVVVLDDMQWAFPESLELFGHLSRLATGSLLVVSCRGTGLELGHPLAQRLAEVHRQRSCDYVALGSLSRGEAGELLEQAAGGRLEAALVDAVYEESGGNPFFLVELGRHLQQDGAAVAAAGAERVLPESIRAAVGLRLSGLSAQTRQVLQLASVFGPGFGFGELAALTDLDEGALLDSLEQAMAEELVRARDAAGERYVFVHALVRQTLYERLSPSRRARLHRRLAEVLERVHADDLEWVAVDLVRQYHASATLPGAERGAVHALTAARVARAADAPADAVMVLRLGLDLVGGEDTALRARVLGELALAEAEAGYFEDAPRTLETAISLLEQDDAPGEAIANLVYAVGSVFAFAVALESLSRAIEPLVARALAAVGQTRGLAWARLKLLNRFARPESVGPVRVLRPVRFDPEAVRIARREGTEADYAFTIDAWDPELGAELEQLIARVDRWQDPIARLRALANVVGYLTLVEPGSSPDADRLCADFAALADDVGLRPHRAFARVFRAALLGAQGEFDAAAEQIEEGRLMFESQPAADSLVTLVGELTAQHAAADWPRLAALMWDLARSPRDAGWLGVACAALAAQAFAFAGEEDRAREVLGYILPELQSAELLEPTNSSAIALAGAAVWELLASDLAEQLLPRATMLADADGREGYMTSTELTVGRLSAVLGRFDQAVEYFDRARATLERRQQPVLRAIVDYDEAIARLAHKEPGAAALLATASARFEELGMREWSRRAARIEGADHELPDHLTAREGEILRLVAHGHTNKEIAAELVLSVHTVERHVQNAYRKIGARNRADASTYVARVGL